MDQTSEPKPPAEHTSHAGAPPSEGVPGDAPGAPPAPAPMAAPGPSGGSPQDERTLAAVSYILTFITGLIIFFVARPEQRYARWHAVQAIGLGVMAVALGILFSIIGTVLLIAFSAVSTFAFGASLLMSLLNTVFGLLVLVLVIVGAVKAYQGETWRLPVLADFADKYADRPAAGGATTHGA